MRPEGYAPPTHWLLGAAVLVAGIAAAFFLSGREGDPVAEPPTTLPSDEAQATQPTLPALPAIALRVLDVPPADVPEDGETERQARELHVRRYIEGRGVANEVVLTAMRRVPRHAFVPAGVRRRAYEDSPLPIGEEQTISQPYIVASMTEEARIEPGDKVLEIGTGSGYQAAVLAAVTEHVFSIEIKEALAHRAAATLRGAGFSAVRVAHADGYYGWPDEAPFDAILVTAAAPHVPPPLVSQLKKGGRLVIPIGSPFAVQDLVLVTKDAAGAVRTRSLYPVRFVPLTGSLGESAD